MSKRQQDLFELRKRYRRKELSRSEYLRLFKQRRGAMTETERGYDDPDRQEIMRLRDLRARNIITQGEYERLVIDASERMAKRVGNPMCQHCWIHSATIHAPTRNARFCSACALQTGAWR